MKVFYDKEERRLVYIGESASPDFWDSHWDTENVKENMAGAKDNRFILNTLLKYMPDKKGRILEGGCGTGSIAYSMHVNGYQVIGVDFAERTIEQVKEAMPELDVRMGDVRNLPFPDNYFTAYWSRGVIEHFSDGYHVILTEMRRVLIDGGYVFLFFPYMSPLRRLKAKFGLYHVYDKDEKENFYQFALDQNTVSKDFKSFGFELLDKKATSGLKGFKDEVGILKPLLQKLFDYQGQSYWLTGIRYVIDQLLATLAGHMIFLVFRNRKQNLGGKIAQ